MPDPKEATSDEKRRECASKLELARDLVYEARELVDRESASYQDLSDTAEGLGLIIANVLEWKCRGC